ncbi:MAG: molybdopterin-dependent oxidoreductase [Pirellulales bacterium]|nr:molybdopterin-dependent oxidoreductase [Pirellulales bacterium]
MTEEPILLRISGEVERPLALRFSDLAALAPEWQVPDIGRLIPGRKGDAVRLEGLLHLAGATPAAVYLTLHASRDDFHASIPLAAVRQQALLVYRLDGQPLPETAGGPIRFLIPEPARCHTAEVDECASVKFVDHIDLERHKGKDNRPADERAHQALHQRP